MAGGSGQSADVAKLGSLISKASRPIDLEVVSKGWRIRGPGRRALLQSSATQYSSVGYHRFRRPVLSLIMSTIEYYIFK